VSCVVSFPKFHYNDLLPTYCGLDSIRCCQQVRNKLATSPSTGKLRGKVSSLMDFGHNKAQVIDLLKHCLWSVSVDISDRVYLDGREIDVQYSNWQPGIEPRLNTSGGCVGQARRSHAWFIVPCKYRYWQVCQSTY